MLFARVVFMLWGHLGNPNFDFDFEAVVSAAAQHNVLVEINNSSLCGSREGSEPRCEQIAAFAREVGGKSNYRLGCPLCA